MALALQSRHPKINLDLSWDTRYPLGDKPLVQPSSLGINLAAFNAAAINLLNRPQNAALSFNYRTYLTGTSAATATLSVNAISGTLGNWVIDSTGNSLANNTLTAGSGSLQVIAADNLGNTISFPVQNWSILAVIQQTSVKWNPGHYGASGGICGGGDQFSKFQPEIADMCKDAWIKGYRLFITWGHLDMGPCTFTGSVGGASSGTLTATVQDGNAVYWCKFSNGQFRSVTVTGTAASWTGALSAGSVTTGHLYYFVTVDAILNYLKTNFSTPKQLVLAILTMTFSGSGRTSGDYSTTPKFIANNSAYGPSPDGSTFGWWGPSPGQAGAYTTAVYRPAVAEQYAQLGEALAAKYDADPNFEAIMDQEDSAVTGPALAANTFGAGYSNDGSFGAGGAFETAMELYLSRWVAAFPHTSVVSENTFLYDVTGTQRFENWMMANRVAPGSSDSAGQSYYATHTSNGWGLAAYMGIQLAGSTTLCTDHRGVVRPMVDVEGGNIGSLSGGSQNNTPLDLINGHNLTVKSSHLFWCHVPSGKSTPPTWAQLTLILRDNPLINIGYPGNYP